MRPIFATLAAAGALGLATPALANHERRVVVAEQRVLDAEGRDFADLPPLPDDEHSRMRHEDMRHGDMDHNDPRFADPGFDGRRYDSRIAWENQRADWLNACRARMGGYGDDYRGYRGGRRDDGVGGAVIGGIVGGVAGNRIAGRGNRTAGTVVGAAAGAVVGAVIDRAEDRNMRRGDNRYDRYESRGDYCESYLDYYVGQQRGWGGQMGYAQPMMMVPVTMVTTSAPAQRCTETVVTEEWVTTTTRPRHRYVPARHDKRVRMVPDKRLRM